MHVFCRLRLGLAKAAMASWVRVSATYTATSRTRTLSWCIGDQDGVCVKDLGSRCRLVTVHGEAGQRVQLLGKTASRADKQTEISRAETQSSGHRD